MTLKPAIYTKGLVTGTKSRRPRIALGPTEDQIQIQIIKECALLVYRGIALSEIIRHIPNGGKRSKAEAGKFKAMGVLSGTPDLHIPVARDGFSSLYIELKDKDGVTSPRQKIQIEILRKLGNKVLVCRTVEQAMTAIKTYLGI